MNVVVVDTSVWISYFRPATKRKSDFDELELALKEGRVFLAPVVIAELLSVPLARGDQKRMIEFLKELPVCESEFDHWARVGALRARCAAKGLSISTPDAHVAQCALDLNGYLMSEDKVFEKLRSIPSLGFKILDA